MSFPDGNRIYDGPGWNEEPGEEEFTELSCDKCGRDIPHNTESGCCLFCDWEHDAQHALPWNNLPVPVLAEPSPMPERVLATDEARESTNTTPQAGNVGLGRKPSAKPDSRGRQSLQVPSMAEAGDHCGFMDVPISRDSRDYFPL